MNDLVERVAKIIYERGNPMNMHEATITARTTIAAMREAIIAAIESERLSDAPADSGDIAYNNAISHARKGVEEMIDAALKELKDETS